MQIIEEKPQREVRFHLDSIHQTSVAVFVSGWFVTDEKVEALRWYSNDVELAQHTKFVSRLDVVEELNLDENNYCSGFITVIDRRGGDLNDLSLMLHDQKLPLTISNEVYRSKPDDILNLLGSERTEFLSKVNLFDATSAKVNTKFYMDICEVDQNNFVVIEGWVLSDNVTKVCLVNAFGESQDISEELTRFYRSDVAEKCSPTEMRIKSGFLTISKLNIINNGVVVKIETLDGNDIIYPVMQSQREYSASELLKMQLKYIDIYDKGFINSGYKKVLNSIATIWNAEDKKKKSNANKHQTIFGEVNYKPLVSLIIPIYGRYDFIQHQLLAFSQDHDFKNHEIIYVLDDPSIEREFMICAEGVFNTFFVPFSIVYSNVNLGFSGANNLGASFAKGEFVLALNSDIMPTSEGWVTRLVNTYNEKSDCGILGACLLYEDDTIQHLGMEFAKDPYYPNIWMNYHPNKGMPIHLMGDGEVRAVEAVTGACMLIKRSLYESVNGFDEGYAIGDFEDSDLCLKITSSGKKVYLNPNERLVHLERLSQNLVDSGDWKFKLTIANGIRQKNKWDREIVEVKKEYA